MIVIFEGADGVGKTTATHLLTRVAREQSLPVMRLHRGVPSRDPLLEYTVDLEDASGEEALWICDRWHWGELIYGPIYRGASLLSGAGHRAVDEFLARRGAYIIHMDQPCETVQQRVHERGDDYVKMEHLPYILEEYRRIREMDSPVHRVTLTEFDELQAHVVLQAARTITRGLA